MHAYVTGIKTVVCFASNSQHNDTWLSTSKNGVHLHWISNELGKLHHDLTATEPWDHG